jgi:hypothetical protein
VKHYLYYLLILIESSIHIILPPSLRVPRSLHSARNPLPHSGRGGSQLRFMIYPIATSLSALSEGWRRLLCALLDNNGAALAALVELWPPGERGPSPSTGRRRCPASLVAPAWDGL